MTQFSGDLKNNRQYLSGSKKAVIFVIALSCLHLSVFTQSTTWIYIARSEEGRYYIGKGSEQMPRGHRGIWVKILADDGSEEISYQEWDCSNRRFRLKQVSSYAADGAALNQQKNLEWAYPTPDSVAASLFEEACGKPRETKYAEVISAQARMRRSPDPNGNILRTAKLGETFPLIPFDPVNDWYGVYDPRTLAEYWLHGNTIKVISGKPAKLQTNKPIKRIRIKKSG